MQSNHAYHLNVSGAMDPMIKAFSHHEVIRLQAEEAPLEEVFLKFYEDTTAEKSSVSSR
jgi:hypothetical protein